MKLNHRDTVPLLLVCLIPVIIIAFLLLSPTVSNTLLTAKRTASWNTFVKNSSSEKRMDTKRFWELREFYSPGHFVFKKEGIAPKDTLFPHTQKHVFLEYISPAFVSYDSLVPEASTKEVIARLPKLANGKKVLARGENFIIFQQASNKAVIVFVANKSEMTQANGFFEYNDEEDSKLVNNKSWLSVSEVVLP